jgi:hypothetical protein
MEVVTVTTTTKTVVSASKVFKSDVTTKRKVNTRIADRKRKSKVQKKSGRTTRIDRQAAGSRVKWNSDEMKKAITAVRTNQMGLNKAARTYHVPKATLLRHVKHTNVRAHDGEKCLGRSSDLPPDIENDLVQHILLLESRFYGLTRQTVLRLAYQIAKANNIATRFK